MEFGEVLVVFILFVILPAVVFDGIRKIKAAKYSAQTGKGNELRASELQQMIRDAAEDAVAPIAARVADLEERLGDESVADLRARLDPAVLAAAMDATHDGDTYAPAPAARRAHS